MKKTHLLTALIFLTVSAAAVFAQSQPAKVPALQVLGKAILRSSSGEVQVSYDWGETWQGASPNMDLPRNAVVRTAYGASARISSMNAEIELKQASRLTFEVLPVNVGEKTTVFLQTELENFEGSGALHIDMTSRPGLRNQFIIASPGGTTTIYDSSSSCDIDVYSVRVQRGSAEFTATGSRGTAFVGPGQYGFVSMNGDTVVRR
jgi:hypothetical protein